MTASMKRYSRLIVLFGGAVACVAINFWLVTTGHYRWPLVVFVAYLVAVSVVIRRLPPVTRDPEDIRGHQFKASRAVRRMGWIYVAGLVFGTLNFLSGGANGTPWWGIVLAFGWSVFLIWICFWIARRLKKAAASQPETPAAP
jgi:hypothetical protein